MARKPTGSEGPKAITKLNMPRQEAEAKLSERIFKGKELRQKDVSTPAGFDATEKEYSKWNSFNNELLKQMFTTAELATEYSFWGASVLAMRQPTHSEKVTKLHEKIDDKIHRLDSIVERLELFSSSNPDNLLSPVVASTITKSRKVFVVHGHDEVTKANLEVFLKELGLEPVVLHRQADEGMTVIEKFEKHSDVGYAFIILTPDEVAYLAAEADKPDDQRRKELRARPNVIFEFGYFVGKLGRPNVCCLHKGDVSLPSDIHGMIYKGFTKSIDEVAYAIMKDLKAAGYSLN